MASQHDISMVESSPLKSLLNFRDIGRTINRLQDKVQVVFPSVAKAYITSSILREGIFYRSARPDEASAQDRDSLAKQYKIRNIVDLRSKTEHVQKNKKHDTSSLAQTSIEIPNIIYHYISLNGPAFEYALIRQLRYTSLFKLLSLMALGYRMEAVSIIGTEVMQPRGLTGLAFDTLAHSTKEVGEIFPLLANEDNFPMMIHCTQGKDRTGLTVLLLLLMLKVPMAAIVADYRASERELESEMEERIGDIRKVGLQEDFARCPEEFAMAVAVYISERYGGIERYLTEMAGVNDGMQGSIREIMLVRQG